MVHFLFNSWNFSALPRWIGDTYLRCSKFANGEYGENTKHLVTGICILRALANLWEQAWFDSTFIVTEQTIKTRITKRIKKYHNLKILKTLELPEGSYKKKVNSFLIESSILFSIHKTNIFNLIKGDTKRNSKAKSEDINSRNMIKMTNTDKRFQENVLREKLKKVAVRFQRQENKRKKEGDHMKRELASSNSDNQTKTDNILRRSLEQFWQTQNSND